MILVWITAAIPPKIYTVDLSWGAKFHPSWSSFWGKICKNVFQENYSIGIMSTSFLQTTRICYQQCTQFQSLIVHWYKYPLVRGGSRHGRTEWPCQWPKVWVNHGCVKRPDTGPSYHLNLEILAPFVWKWTQGPPVVLPSDDPLYRLTLCAHHGLPLLWQILDLPALILLAGQHKQHPACKKFCSNNAKKVILRHGIKQSNCRKLAS